VSRGALGRKGGPAPLQAVMLDSFQHPSALADVCNGWKADIADTEQRSVAWDDEEECTAGSSWARRGS
jgi:hypothetical protein